MYKIGTISKFLGIPEHVLRFYEKKGLIKSKHLGESPTRYYDEFDICLLMQIKQLRNLNFSVDEIRDIFEHQDKREDVNYYEVLSCKQQEVFDSIELLTRVQQRLIQMMDSFQINEKAKDQLVTTDLPELFWIYNMDEVRSPESMRMDEGTNRIILGEINPDIRLMAFIDRENIEVASKQNSCRYDWGITFPTEFLFKIPENVRRQLFWIPLIHTMYPVNTKKKTVFSIKKRSVHYAGSCMTKRPPILTMPLLSFCREEAQIIWFR